VHWATVTDRMLAAVDPYRSPGGAFVDLSVSTGGSRRRPEGVRELEGLEGLAHTFLFAGFRIAGERGADPSGLLDRYATAFAVGTDPRAEERWPRPRRATGPGSRVRMAAAAATIALTLQLTRPWLWNRLNDGARERTVNWLTDVVAEPYPPVDCGWFMIVTESFLHWVGGYGSAQRIRARLSAYASPPRPGRVGNEREHSYGLSMPWSPHLHPLLWAHLFDPAGTLCTPAVRRRWQQDLAARLDDDVRLLGADGAPLLQGHRLADPLAAAAPLWIGALAGAGGLAPGLVRRAASGILRHLTTAGAIRPGGVNGLSARSTHHSWTGVRHPEPGAPYRTASGMLGLMLPADHPVWAEPEQPLPIEEGDAAHVLPAPGWLVSARRDDGITLVLNHGTDRPAPGGACADDPRYARLGYSTATAPLPVGPTARGPIDNSVVVLDRAGRATHRSGFELLFAEQLPGGTLAAASRGLVHWVRWAHRVQRVSGPGGTNDGVFGPGPEGPPGDRPDQRAAVTLGPLMTVASVVRAGVEVRLVRLDLPPGATAGPPAAWHAVRLGGWPVAEPAARQSHDRQAAGPTAEAGTARLRSRVHNLRGFEHGGVAAEKGTAPIARRTATPWLATAGSAPVGEVLAAMVTLDRGAVPRPEPELSVQAVSGGAHRVMVAWPDGELTTLTLPGPG
jgi:hypothetical protein